MAAAKKRSKKASKKTSKKSRKKVVKSNHIPIEILEKRHKKLTRIIKARHGHLATA
jgi:hypothetical protein